MLKNNLPGIIIGICLTITVLSVWYSFTLSSQVQTNTGNIANIAAFIEQSIKANQK